MRQNIIYCAREYEEFLRIEADRLVLMKQKQRNHKLKHAQEERALPEIPEITQIQKNICKSRPNTLDNYQKKKLKNLPFLCLHYVP